jgi:agmatinase
MATKQEIIAAFDANGVSSNDNIFGLPFGYEHSETVVIPVPWEVTVSYSNGTADGPFAPEAWKKGIFMLEVDEELRAKSDTFRALAEQHIELLEQGSRSDHTSSINRACAEMVDWVEGKVSAELEAGKNVVLLGGDHSTPLGYFKALAKHHSSFGILQIDAHADLRDAYEDFEYSHASIMFNALKLPQVEKLVQVGIRDYCEAEAELVKNSNGRVVSFYDRDLKHAQFRGTTWHNQCETIVASLPQKVYLSFDIDGLTPAYCPNTGTPVAGGFEVEQVLYLIEQILASGRTIIGVDLNEVAPNPNDPDDEWDANVGARLLYRLCNLLSSQIK